jgi:hypothetical protein
VNESILEAEAEVKVAREKLRLARRKAQKSCEHPPEEIVEGAYAPDSYGHYHTPPYRVCKLCGYAEEGWHCGYWKLGNGVYSGIPSLSRKEAWKFVKGPIHSQEVLSEIRYDRMDEDKLWEK